MNVKAILLVVLFTAIGLTGEQRCFWKLLSRIQDQDSEGTTGKHGMENFLKKPVEKKLSLEIKESFWKCISKALDHADRGINEKYDFNLKLKRLVKETLGELRSMNQKKHRSNRRLKLALKEMEGLVADEKNVDAENEALWFRLLELLAEDEKNVDVENKALWFRLLELLAKEEEMHKKHRSNSRLKSALQESNGEGLLKKHRHNHGMKKVFEAVEEESVVETKNSRYIKILELANEAEGAGKIPLNLHKSEFVKEETHEEDKPRYKRNEISKKPTTDTSCKCTVSRSEVPFAGFALKADVSCKCVVNGHETDLHGTFTDNSTEANQTTTYGELLIYLYETMLLLSAALITTLCFVCTIEHITYSKKKNNRVHVL